ncbi:MAG: hypothetical protein ABIP21_11695, partial [Acidimicrobiia bacterium]
MIRSRANEVFPESVRGNHNVPNVGINHSTHRWGRTADEDVIKAGNRCVLVARPGVGMGGIEVPKFVERVTEAMVLDGGTEIRTHRVFVA